MNPAPSAFVTLLTRAAEHWDEGAGSSVGEPLTFVTTGTLTLQQRHKRVPDPAFRPSTLVPDRIRASTQANTRDGADVPSAGLDEGWQCATTRESRMNQDLSTRVVDSLLGMAVVISAVLGWEWGFRRTVNLAGVSGGRMSHIGRWS